MAPGGLLEHGRQKQGPPAGSIEQMSPATGHAPPQVYGSLDIEVTNQGSDFNNDGVFDLCLATPSIGGAGSQIVVYLGNGDGSFVQTPVRTLVGHVLSNCPGDIKR